MKSLLLLLNNNAKLMIITYIKSVSLILIVGDEI